MADKVPVKLNKDTIVESLFELRFSNSSGAATSELLPGMLFQKLRKQFPSLVNLPLKEMPSAIRQKDVNLQYQPVVRLEGDNCSIGIGDRVVVLAINRPYQGWEHKKILIKTLLEALSDASLIENIERYALKYVNIVPYGGDIGTSLSSLKLDLKFGDFDLSGKGINLRAEVNLDGFTNIVTITPSASYQKNDETIEGILVGVDTINEDGCKVFDSKHILDGVELLHHTEKKIFFGLLHSETIEKLEPVWE